MKKYSFYLISFIFTFYAHVMEIDAMYIKKDPSMPDKSGVCFLATMPLDVCNRIAYFLPWETKKQLSERMGKRKSELPYQGNHNTKIFTNIDSTDKSKKVTISLLFDDNPRNEIMIFSRLNSRETAIKTFHITMPYNVYSHAAIACSGNILAFIQKQERCSEQILHYYHNILMVYKIKKEKMFKVLHAELPEGYTPLGIDFNYQGTHVYLPGIQYDSKGDFCKKNKRFLLEVTDIYTDKNIDQKNALQQYFKHHRIGKK